MKKTEMLKKNYQFKLVLEKGKFFIEKELQIVVLKNNKKINFLGIAIGTKNGKAFQRNRAKRIIRECYKNLENQLTEGNSIVILIKKDFDLNNLKYNEVLELMNSCFQKAKIVKEEKKKLKKFL